MSKHTPGPWVVRDFPTRAYGRRAFWVMDAIPDEGGKVIANAICQAAGTNDDEEANARLIAAAPDLLEACKAINEGPTGYSNVDEANDYGWAWQRIMNKVRAAIAKAEGGDS